MTSHTLKHLIFIALAGASVFVIEQIITPSYGMSVATAVSAATVLVLLGVSRLVLAKERDEREYLLQLQADSVSLFVVLSGLLVATMIWPKSDYAMVFWCVLGLALLSRIISFLFNRYK